MKRSKMKQNGLTSNRRGERRSPSSTSICCKGTARRAPTIAIAGILFILMFALAAEAGAQPADSTKVDTDTRKHEPDDTEHSSDDTEHATDAREHKTDDEN